jgi:hypothetical protein
MMMVGLMNEGLFGGGLEIGESEFLGFELFKHVADAAQEFGFAFPEIYGSLGDVDLAGASDVVCGGGEFFEFFAGLVDVEHGMVLLEVRR